MDTLGIQKKIIKEWFRKTCMHILTAQTLDLVLISKIRSFEKSIKFLAYILISCKMRIIWKSAPALLHSSNSKFQTCN